MDSAYHVVLVTVSSTSEAKSIAHHVLEERLAACVNLVPKISSIYWWEGKIEECRETLMIMKTRQDKLDELISSIKQLHSYDIPEIKNISNYFKKRLRKIRKVWYNNCMTSVSYGPLAQRIE